MASRAAVDAAVAKFDGSFLGMDEDVAERIRNAFRSAWPKRFPEIDGAFTQPTGSGLTATEMVGRLCGALDLLGELANDLGQPSAPDGPPDTGRMVAFHGEVSAVIKHELHVAQLAGAYVTALRRDPTLLERAGGHWNRWTPAWARFVLSDVDIKKIRTRDRGVVETEVSMQVDLEDRDRRNRPLAFRAPGSPLDVFDHAGGPSDFAEEKRRWAERHSRRNPARKLLEKVATATAKSGTKKAIEGGLVLAGVSGLLLAGVPTISAAALAASPSAAKSVWRRVRGRPQPDERWALIEAHVSDETHLVEPARGLDINVPEKSRRQVSEAFRVGAAALEHWLVEHHAEAAPGVRHAGALIALGTLRDEADDWCQVRRPPPTDFLLLFFEGGADQLAAQLAEASNA